MGVRKNSRTLTDDEKSRFTAALDKINTEGGMAEFASLHANLATSGIHRTSHFLPWHREFILRFERRLQEADPSVSIPYWNAATDNNPSDSLFWGSNYLQRFDANWGLGRRFLVGRVELANANLVGINQGRNDYTSFRTELENNIHNPCHNWIGGIAARNDSPRDPAFFLIHAWIDLLWTRWQMTHPSAPFESSGTGFGLNDAMPGWPDRTPASVLDHRTLGYTYDIEASAPTGTVRHIAIGVNLSIKDFGVFDDNTRHFSLFEAGRVSSISPLDIRNITQSVGDVKASLDIKMEYKPDNSVSISYTAKLFDDGDEVAKKEESVNAPPDVEQVTSIHLRDHHSGDPDTANMSIVAKNLQAM